MTYKHIPVILGIYQNTKGVKQMATLKLIKDAQPMGVYQPTLIDEMKKNADILVHYANGGSFTIEVKNPSIKVKGRGVKCCYENGNFEVTENKLKQLEKQHKVICDF